MVRVSFAKRYVKHDGKLYPPSSPIEIRDEDLEQFLELGAVLLVREAEEKVAPKRKRRGAKP